MYLYVCITHITHPHQNTSTKHKIHNQRTHKSGERDGDCAMDLKTRMLARSCSHHKNMASFLKLPLVIFSRV